MSVARRAFLRTSLGVGALALTMASGLAQGWLSSPSAKRLKTSVARPLLLLRSSGDELFAHAILATFRQARTTSVIEVALDAASVATPGRLVALLRQHRQRRGLTVVALTDDFTHCLVEETVRDLGGSVGCRGLHRGPLDVAATSGHVFASTAASQGIGTTLAAGLCGTDSDFHIEEHSSGADATVAQAACEEPAPWARVLGQAYGRMALGLWEPRPVRELHSRGPATVHPGAASLVSMVARI